MGKFSRAPKAKRYQVERKLAWAAQQMNWATTERLFAEERQMRQLMQDCKLMLAEMDLIEKGRADRSQLVNIAPATAGAKEANEHKSQSHLA